MMPAALCNVFFFYHCGQLGNVCSGEKKTGAKNGVSSKCVFISPVSQQQKNLEGYVGFASLPNQVYRKSVKRGFEFTLMVVGKKTGCCARLCFYMNHFIVFTAVGIYKCSSVASVCLAVFMRRAHHSHICSVYPSVSEN